MKHNTEVILDCLSPPLHSLLYNSLLKILQIERINRTRKHKLSIVCKVNMAIASIQSAILLSFLVLFLGPYLQTAKLCSCSDDHKVGKCHSIERLALLDFKKGVEDPSNLLSTWRLENEDCCKWHGVGCNNVTGYVEELDLNAIKNKAQATRLSGGISPALAQLKHLKYLDLRDNAFRNIPDQFIGSVKELRYLDLSRNCFEGRLPQQLGNLSYLHHLGLSDTCFSI
ncbi:hypothetical protein Syun_016223 [Stephania yunnanensis]|uniref:Leucine-rich repeat-containing N-terminal plant-type domain-containing protein n=1 Tax=Stephania yunnanensis TaxID=152371 RepID=A0AAP0J755_9MAGN